MVDCRGKQIGQPYDGSRPFTQQQDEFTTEGSFTRSYNPNTYSLVPIHLLTGGATNYFATYVIRQDPTHHTYHRMLHKSHLIE